MFAPDKMQAMHNPIEKSVERPVANMLQHFPTNQGPKKRLDVYKNWNLWPSNHFKPQMFQITYLNDL